MRISDDKGERFRTAVHIFKSSVNAAVLQGLGGGWLATDLTVDYTHGELRLSLQPVTEDAAVWNGEGKPPVGCECEANFTGEWVKFELRYYGEHYVIFKTAFEVQRTRHDFDTCGVKFRPLRTAEQLAAEAREKAIRAMAREVGLAGQPIVGALDLLADVYDAGYRKSDA